MKTAPLELPVIKICQNYDKMSGNINFDLGNEVVKANGVRKGILYIHYSVDFIFLSFGIMGFIVEL